MRQAAGQVSDELREYMRRIGANGGKKSRASVSLEEWRARGRKGGLQKGKNARARKRLARAEAIASPVQPAPVAPPEIEAGCPRCGCPVSEHSEQRQNGQGRAVCPHHPRPDGCFGVVD